MRMAEHLADRPYAARGDAVGHQVAAERLGIEAAQRHGQRGGERLAVRHPTQVAREAGIGCERRTTDALAEPLELAVATKALAHWITTGVPLVIATPVFALFLNLDLTATAAVALTLLVGTPALTFIGLIGAGLTVTLRRGGILLSVLVLPLAIPVLIFGVAASNAAIVGPLPFGTPFTILCALTLLSLVIGPFAAALALRQGQD